MQLRNILNLLENVKLSTNRANQYTAKCPAHEDKENSLAISSDSKGIGIHCFAGCSKTDILGALGLEMKDLFNEELSALDKSKNDVEMEVIRKIASYSKVQNNNYFARKGIFDINGLEIYFNSLKNIFIPIKDINGYYRGGQFINEKGDKWYLKNTIKKNSFCLLGDHIKDGGIVFVSEGVATGLTILNYYKKANTVVCAMDSSNMKNVIGEIKKRYNVTIVIAADNDAHKRENTGLNAAKEIVAQHNDVFYTYPVFKEQYDGDKPLTDFNDLFLIEGIESLHNSLSINFKGKNDIEDHFFKKTTKVTPTDGEMIILPFSGEKPKKIQWVWEPYFAKGKLSIIAGDPGLGKSQLSIAIASYLSHGIPLPGSSKRKAIPPGKALFISDEDDVNDTMLPRLMAANANLENCFFYKTILIKEDKEKMFEISEDIKKMEEAINKIDNLSIIFIDPISAFLGGVDSHKQAEVRGLLSKLKDIAQRKKCAIVMIHHLNKSTEKSIMNRVAGSSAFIQAVRSAFGVIKARGRKFLIPIKNNIGNDETCFEFMIEPYNFGDEIKTSRILWGQTLSLKEVEEMVADDFNDDIDDDSKELEVNKMNYARDFLFNVLSNGAEKVSKINSLAKKKGIKNITLRRAKENLKIDSYQSWDSDQGRNVWFWIMPKGTYNNDN